MEVEEEFYDVVQVTTGASETGSNIGVQEVYPTGYKSLLKQQSDNEYANINRGNVAMDRVRPTEDGAKCQLQTKGKNKKKVYAKYSLLGSFVVYSTVLSLTALVVATVSFVQWKGEVAKYRTQMDRMMVLLNGSALSVNYQQCLRDLCSMQNNCSITIPRMYQILVCLFTTYILLLLCV